MRFIDWIKANEVLFAFLGGLGLLLFLGSLVAIPIIIAYMPRDYFVRLDQHRFPIQPVRQVLRILKNILGSILFIAGILMLVLPGQGILTMVIGLSLVDFPGKHRFQISLVRLKGVHRSIAWIRRKARRPPLIIPKQPLSS